MKVSLVWGKSGTVYDSRSVAVFSWQDDEEQFFGEIQLSEDDDEIKLLDSEHMGKEFVKKLLCIWVDQAELKE